VHVVLPDLEVLRSRVGAHGTDDVLRTIAQRLLHTVRDGEMVARDSDDEFAAVLGLLGDSDRAVEAFLQRVRSGLAEPIELGRSSVDIAPQFVVSVFPRDGRTAEALLRHAALERMNGHAAAA
jgi:GGDEF domain-containing protein